MYKIEITLRAIRSLQKIPGNIKKIVIKKIDLLKSFSISSPQIKALKSAYKGYHRMRVGDYRVLFKVEHKKLVIIVIDVFPRSKGY